VNQLLRRFNEIGVGKVLVTPSMKTDKPFEWASHFSLEPIADIRGSDAFTIPVGNTPGYIAEKTLHKPLNKWGFRLCVNQSPPKNMSRSICRIRLPLSRFLQMWRMRARIYATPPAMRLRAISYRFNDLWWWTTLVANARRGFGRR